MTDIQLSLIHISEAAAQSAVDIYREIIKDNIDYHILKQDMKFDSDRLDEIVDLMLETVCTARKRVRIAGDDYPAELVKSKFMKLDGEHISMVTEKNNMHDVDTSMFFKWVFKAFVAVYLVTHTFDTVSYTHLHRVNLPRTFTTKYPPHTQWHTEQEI